MAKKQNEYAVELRPVAELQPYENNPRLNDDAVDACANSLRAFGFRQPIVVDADGVIIAGHTRYKAALKLGLERVPVHVAKELTSAQVAEYRIADNKTGELAEWDFPKLKLELVDLQTADADFNPLDFGFNEAELLALLGDEAEEGLTDPDDAPEPPETSDIKPGTLFKLGQHRLLCGDSTSAQDVERLFGGEKADLYVTDPPYNVDYTGGTGMKIENDAMAADEFDDFLAAAFTNADGAMQPGAAFYIWHTDSNGLQFRIAAQRAGWQVRECLIWVKNALVLGR
ncbi:MAG: ParB N-terminal domain-containing protein, partial [Thermoguttaceae bacterium]|nr:ParB N-terminal domain-containing protein [Thermoguttaceae bacterium]